MRPYTLGDWVGVDHVYSFRPDVIVSNFAALGKTCFAWEYMFKNLGSWGATPLQWGWGRLVVVSHHAKFGSSTND